MSANARHSAATPRWGTPPEWVAMARVALGGRIELDPMSEKRFNATVGAERYYTTRDNAFAKSWTCETMLINPPGGLVVDAWWRLCATFARGQIGRAVWIGFSVEQLCVLADDALPWHPLDYSLLLPRRRISFVAHNGKRGSPSHTNYVVGLGIERATFERAFPGRGRFHHGRLVHAGEPSERRIA